MTSPVVLVNTAADTWQVAINRINQLANLASNSFVTADSSANGSVTTGNTYLAGSFGANNLVATSGLRGGNVQSAAVLPITSNVSVGNTTTNVQIKTLAGGGLVNVGIVSLNATMVAVGANVFANATTVFVGNSTVNAVLNSSMLAFGGVNTALVTNRAAVAKNTTTTYARTKLNYVNTSSISVTVTDDAASGQVNVQIDATSSVVAGGSNTFVQFNDSTVFAGSAGFTFNKTSNNITVGNTVFTDKVSYDAGNVVAEFITYTTTGGSAQEIDTWSVSAFRAGKYTVSCNNNIANGKMMTELMVLHDGGDALITEFGLINSNGSLGTFTANANSTFVRVWFTPGSANTTLKTFRTLISV